MRCGRWWMRQGCNDVGKGDPRLKRLADGSLAGVCRMSGRSCPLRALEGIGRATAKALAKLGLRLALVARSAGDVAAAAGALAPAETLAVPADVADPEQVREAVGRAVAHFGAAGCGGVCGRTRRCGGRWRKSASMSWRAVINTNLCGGVLRREFAWPHGGGGEVGGVAGDRERVVLCGAGSVSGVCGVRGGKGGAERVDSWWRRGRGRPRESPCTRWRRRRWRRDVPPGLVTPQRSIRRKDADADGGGGGELECVDGTAAVDAGEVIYVRKSLD